MNYTGTYNTLAFGTTAPVSGYFAYNSYGYYINQNFLDIPDMNVTAGTYYLQLYARTTSDGSPVYWDQSGGSSQVYQSYNGWVSSAYSNSFTVLGNYTATTINTAAPYYVSSALGSSLLPAFEGGVLRIDQSGSISQNFTLDTSTTNTIDSYGHLAVFSGNFTNAGGPGKLTTTSTGGGSTSFAGSVGTSASPLSTFTNNGTVIFQGTAHLYAGQITNTAGGFSNLGTISGPLTNIGGTFDNAGTVGAVDNQAGATFINSGASGAVTNAGAVINSWTIASLTNAAGTFANNLNGSVSGLTTITGGTVTNLGGSFAAVDNKTSGTFANNYGTTASLTNAGTATNGGTITGTLTNTAGTFANNAGGSVGGLTTITGGTVTNLGGSFAAVDNKAGGTFANTSGTTASLTNAGTATNGGAITGTLTNTAGTFTNSAGGSVGGLTTITGGTVTNNGGSFAAVDNKAGGTFANTSGTTASLTNAGTATNGGAITGTLTNTAGTFTNNAGGTVGGLTTITGGTVTNSGGSFAVVDNQAGGTFASTSGTTASLTNAGTTTNGGAITGTLTNTGGTFTNSAGGSVGGLTTITGGTVTNSGGSFAAVDNQAGGTFANTSGTTASLTNAGTATNGGAITGTLTNTAGTFTNSAGGSVGGLTTITGGTVTNNGGSFAAVDNQAGGTFANTSGTAASLTNAGTATNGGTITGTLTNTAGTFANDGSVTGLTTITGGTVTNAGLVGVVDNQAGGTFTNSGTAGAVTNAGTGGNSGTVASLTNTAGTFGNSGTISGSVTVSGGAVTTSGAINGATTTVSGGSLTVTGAGGTLVSAAGTLNVSGGTVDMGGYAQTIATVSISSGGTLKHGSLTGAVTSSGGAIADLSGSASVTTTAGLTTLTGANTYTGVTNVNGGTLTGGAANTFSAASVTTVATGGALDFGGFAQTINAVGLTGGTLKHGSLTGAVTSSGGAISDLSGASTLTVVAGETLISGTNAYTGPTFVNGGALVGAGANAFSTASLMGVNAGGTLDLGGFDQQLRVLFGAGTVTNRGPASAALKVGVDDASSTFDGVIQDGIGKTGLTKTGTGTFVLTGLSSYTGATNITGGALIVDGSIGLSSLTTVAAGATLSGVGVVGATSVAGVLAPGNGTPGTSLSINGSLTFAPTASLVVTANSATASLVNVSGTAALAGNVMAGISAAMPQKSYTIVKSAGLGGTQFAGLAAVGVPSGFTAGLAYSATDVFLTMTASLGGSQALPGNGSNVARAINAWFNINGSLPQNFLNLFGLSGAGLQSALNSLSGEVATGGQQPTMFATASFMQSMLNHDDGAFVGDAQGGNVPLAYAPQAPKPDAWYALAVKDAPTFAKAALAAPRWSVWAMGFGGYGRLGGNQATGASNVSSSAVGVASGFDYRVTPDTKLGFAFSGGSSNWNLSQVSGSGRSDFFQAGMYGSTRVGPAYVSGAIAFANHWVTTTRTAAFGNLLQARYSAQTFAGRIESGYRFGTPLGGLAPYGAVQTQRTNTPTYSEADLSMGGFGLTYMARGANATRAELGMRYDASLPLTGAELILRARAAWAHDWTSASNVTALFQLIPATSFITSGARPAHDLALLSGGAELKLASGLGFFGKFDSELSSRAKRYGGSGGLRYRW